MMTTDGYIISEFTLFVIGPTTEIDLVPGYSVEMTLGPVRASRHDAPCSYLVYIHSR